MPRPDKGSSWVIVEAVISLIVFIVAAAILAAVKSCSR